MSEEPKETAQSMFSKLKQERDELKLKMHLASREARDQWEKLEGKWKEVQQRAEPLTGATKEAATTTGAQAKKVAGAAMDVVAREIAAGYEKLRRLFD